MRVPYTDGLLELNPPTSEPNLLVLSAFGWAPIVVDVAPLEPGGLRDVGRLRFDRGYDLEGIVRSADGKPVAGAEVVVSEDWSAARGESDADGRFRLALLPVRALHLRIRAPRLPQHCVSVSAHPSLPLEVVLRPGGTLEAHVVDETNAPLPGAEVSVEPADESVYESDGRCRIDLVTDSQGRATASFSAGKHQVRAGAAGRHAEPADIDVQEGQTTTVRLVVPSAERK